VVLKRLAVAVMMGASCAPIEGPVLVEAVVLADGGEVVIDDVQLERILDLRTGRGRDFDVRGDFRINGNDFLTMTDDFDEVVESIRRGGGSDLEPHMSFDGTRYRAEDYETLYYFTLTANFEAAFAYAREAGDVSRASSDNDDERAIVALFGSLVLSEFVPLPLISSDNAAYVPPIDGWLAFRAALQGGVPFGMHRGVIAHEFGHRLFFHNVFSTVDRGFDAWKDTGLNSSEEPDEVRAQMLLKGVDEGLADVFAIASEADKDAINDAFALAGGLFEQEAGRRDVEGPFATVATYDNLSAMTLDASLLEACGITSREFGAAFNFYCIGTVLAATLWEASGRDAEVMRAEIEPAIIAALPAVGEALVNGVPFDVDVFLEPLVQALQPGARRAALCTAIAVRFQRLIAPDRIASCL
jgi:hypothetical protein